MVVWNLPAQWNPWVATLAHHLQARLAWRMAPLLLGILFARGRRTVASWLRAAGIRHDFADYYDFLGSQGRQPLAMAGSLLRRALEIAGVGDRLLFALDDTPTKRYGPKVQGAGIHHNPTPGPTDQKFLYGHLWVTLAWVVRHPRWGTISLPLLALLYVRQKDICDRKDSPWDEASRRPSHADRRKALRRQSLEQAFSRTGHDERLTRKLQRLIRGLIRLVS